ncbi:MAG: hypothetical protein U5O39_05360 [Gammaproteobacteria bacterium]|nr:hypothetical protein [Gammaproteobacteria bacterium]
MSEPTPLWRPGHERIAESKMTRFMERVSSAYAIDIANYADLYRWSVEHPEKFWETVWTYSQHQVIGPLARSYDTGSTHA